MIDESPDQKHAEHDGEAELRTRDVEAAPLWSRASNCFAMISVTVGSGNDGDEDAGEDVSEIEFDGHQLNTPS